MPKTSSNLSEAQQYFRKQVLDLYDLEDDFIKKLCDAFSDACEKHLSSSNGVGKSANAAKVSTKNKTKRKKSAYNLYVREMMKTEEIQSLDHKDKMCAIAKQWKSISEVDKAKYIEMANNENSAPLEEAQVNEE